MDKKKILVEIEGRPEHLSQLVKMFQTIEYLGNVGSSRTVSMWVDGDGAGNVRFRFPKMLGGIMPEESARRSSDDQDEYKFSID